LSYGVVKSWKRFVINEESSSPYAAMLLKLIQQKTHIPKVQGKESRRMKRDDAGAGRRGLRATLSPELLEVVRDRYGLDRVNGAVDLGGSSNLNVLIQDGKLRYVVRVYRPYVTEARLRDLQRVRRELAAGGVPSPGVLSTWDGQPWITLDSHLVEVEYYVGHDANMNSWKRLAMALPMLGRIHTILQDVEIGLDGKRPLFANHIEPQDVLDKTFAGTQRIRGWASSPAERYLADAAEELAHRVVAAERDLVSTLPRQLIHGDFWDNNVFFRDGRLVLVTDFDFMGERARIDDVALTLYFTSLKYAETAASDAHLWRLRRLVDAYDSGLANPLSSAERAALPLALARQPLWSIGGWVALLDDEPSARHHAAGTVWAVDWALGVTGELDRWQTTFA
jgi:Ser/Thr protein kinase RdoA (MazF antagonist)